MSDEERLDRFERVGRAAVGAIAQELETSTQVMVIISDPIAYDGRAPALVMVCSPGVDRIGAAAMLAGALACLEDGAP